MFPIKATSVRLISGSAIPAIIAGTASFKIDFEDTIEDLFTFQK